MLIILSSEITDSKNQKYTHTHAHAQAHTQAQARKVRSFPMHSPLFNSESYPKGIHRHHGYGKMSLQGHHGHGQGHQGYGQGHQGHGEGQQGHEKGSLVSF